MREVDRRSKIDRRNFLKTAAAVPPAAAVASTTGVSISDAWADNAKALKPETLKTLARVARDIYPHDHLVDHYYIVGGDALGRQGGGRPECESPHRGRHRPPR